MDTTNAIGLSLILEKTKEFHDKDIYHVLAEVEKITGDELFSIDEGASRTVISHDSWDFVLKVNTYEYEEEDVNAREECNYTSAKEYKVEDFLLPIKKFYCIGSLDFYIQPKITSIYSHMRTSAEKSSWDIYRDKASEKDFIFYMNLFDRMPNDFLKICLGYYGAEFMGRVRKWATAQKVNDLHGSNVGFYHERPVLFDYAGFFG